MLWRSDEIGDVTGGRVTAGFEASGVSIDTRSLKKGDLFVALTDQRDGHEFVATAFKAGAVAALVSRVPDGVSPDAPLVIVEDVLAALGAMARAARSRFTGKVIAITGSVGKTSTKEMFRVALAGQGLVHAAERSFNNHWGVPLTLARMPKGADFAVIEIGMNAPGEIEPLSKLTRPDVAVITNVEPVHMAAFKNIRGIAREKAEIFAGMAGGVTVLNRDTKMYPVLVRAARRAGIDPVRFGYAGRPEFALQHVVPNEGGQRVRYRRGQKGVSFELSAPGSHFAMNAVAVLAGVEAIGADVGMAAGALRQWQPPAGRGNRVHIFVEGRAAEPPISLIDESFNANPASVGAALEAVLATAPTSLKGRRIVILGDMLELGVQEKAHHLAMAQHPAIKKMDIVHCVGPLMETLFRTLPKGQQGRYAIDCATFLEDLPPLAAPGDVVMVKGSKGIALGPVVDAIAKLGKTEPDFVAEEF